MKARKMSMTLSSILEAKPRKSRTLFETCKGISDDTRADTLKKAALGAVSAKLYFVAKAGLHLRDEMPNSIRQPGFYAFLPDKNFSGEQVASFR